MSKRRFSYFLFDWDGCLANTLSIWLKVFKKTFAEFKLFPTREEIIAQVFGDWEGPKRLGVSDNERFISRLLKLAKEAIIAAPLHQGVKETLVKLKQQGKELAIVSTTKRQVLLPALAFHQLSELFGVVLSDEDAVKDKPAPEIIQKALEQLEADKDQALIVGDSGKDVAAGKNASITTVIFYPPENKSFYSPEMVESWQGDVVIDKFEELLSLAA